MIGMLGLWQELIKMITDLKFRFIVDRVCDMCLHARGCQPYA